MLPWCGTDPNAGLITTCVAWLTFQRSVAFWPMLLSIKFGLISNFITTGSIGGGGGGVGDGVGGGVGDGVGGGVGDGAGEGVEVIDIVTD